MNGCYWFSSHFFSCEWSGLKAVDVVLSLRHVGEGAPAEAVVRYYISPAPLAAEELWEGGSPALAYRIGFTGASTLPPTPCISESR